MLIRLALIAPRCRQSARVTFPSFTATQYRPQGTNIRHLSQINCSRGLVQASYAASMGEVHEKKEVLLVGFGAVGVIYSLILQRSQRARVTVVARSNYEAVRKEGIHIKSVKYGDIPAWKPDRVCSSVEEALSTSTPYSYILIATKVLPTISPTSKLVAPLLSKTGHPQPVFVLLQNGLGIEEDLYSAAEEPLKKEGDVNVNGRKKPQIVSCTVFIGANLLSERVVEHNHFDRVTAGIYKQGNYTDLTQTPEEVALLEDIGGMLRAGGSEVTLVPEIQRHRFHKNLWNLAFSSIATATRLPVREIFADPAIEAEIVPIIRALMFEALAVGRAMGFDQDALPDSVVDDIIESTAKIHRREDAKHKASMLLDAELGKPLEVDVIMGWLLNKAKELGVKTPRMEMMHGLLTIMQGHILRNLKKS